MSLKTQITEDRAQTAFIVSVVAKPYNCINKSMYFTTLIHETRILSNDRMTERQNFTRKDALKQ